MSAPTGNGSLGGRYDGVAPPPQNLEAEQSVLGAVLLSEHTLPALVIDERLQPEDFYRESHGRIYQAMLDLHTLGEPVDALTLVEHLKQTNQLDDVGGRAAVELLAGSVPAVGNVRQYARIVRDNAMLRRLLHASYDIQARVHGHEAPPRELVDMAERLILEVAHEDSRKDFRSIEQLLESELAKLEELSREGKAITGTPSGFEDVDAITGGFQPGNLIILAARPSMGKSALMANFAENAALGSNQAVALFSLEMSEGELAQRFIASQASIRGDDLRKGKVPPTRWAKILEASNRLAHSPLFVDDSSDLSVLDVRAKARRLSQQNADGLGLILIDYLQLMRAGANVENRVEQIGQISRGLKTLARELEVPVIALSQLNRGVEQRTDKRPVLSDLRESGCLAGDTPVYLPDANEYRPIAELAGLSGFRVLALDTRTSTLESCRVSRAIATGRKPVSELRTRLGRSVRATANHRFLTARGWRRLDELRAGDVVALPRGRVSPAEPARGRGGVAVAGRPRAAQSCAKRGRPAESAVWWDRIVAIDPAGEDDVYDLTVERHHNFVAADMIVHNSIEQDADLVMFIYRDEYYDRESEREGIADLIIAKHRNGGLGTVELTFQKDYPRFMSYVSEDRY